LIDLLIKVCLVGANAAADADMAVRMARIAVHFMMINSVGV